MRFLIDAHHIGARQTGNETWIRNVSRELVHVGGPTELTFATTQLGSQRLTGITGRPPALLSASAVRRLAIDLPKLARSAHVDAMLVQYTMPPRVSSPCVVMVHDTSFEDAAAVSWMPRGTRIRIRWSVRTAARRAERLLAPSEFTRQCLLRLYDVSPESVLVSPNAVDPELARLIDAASSSDPKPNRARVLAVGNVLPRKNLVTLAAAVARLREAGIHASLRVVGSVPDQSRQLESEIRAFLPGAVSFTGYVDDKQLAAEYVAADVLGFPSLFEGFGIPALEAMHAGLPVVASDTTSLPEIVGDAGLCVPPQEVDRWTEALGQVISNTKLADDLRQRGRRRAAVYSWRESADVVLRALNAAAEIGH